MGHVSARSLRERGAAGRAASLLARFARGALLVGVRLCSLASREGRFRSSGRAAHRGWPLVGSPRLAGVGALLPRRAIRIGGAIVFGTGSGAPKRRCERESPLFAVSNRRDGLREVLGARIGDAIRAGETAGGRIGGPIRAVESTPADIGVTIQLLEASPAPYRNADTRGDGPPRRYRNVETRIHDLGRAHRRRGAASVCATRRPGAGGAG